MYMEILVISVLRIYFPDVFVQSVSKHAQDHISNELTLHHFVQINKLMTL